MNAGKFYALPQSPQLFKQLLMVAGVDRYYQMARCFRDEDLRADRQPEFTQVDIEMSFCTQEHVLGLIEEVMAEVMQGVGAEWPAEIPRLTYADAMDRFGSDRPDVRFGMELNDLSSVFATSEFKVFAGALASGGASRASTPPDAATGAGARSTLSTSSRSTPVRRDWHGSPSRPKVRCAHRSPSSSARTS
jgi:aspartyl-tRNA synthetase